MMKAFVLVAISVFSVIVNLHAFILRPTFIHKKMDSSFLLPSSTSKDIEIKTLGNWINTQKANYKNNENSMKNEEIIKEWEKFMNDYKELFKTNEELWYENKNKVIDYIKEYNIFQLSSISSL